MREATLRDGVVGWLLGEDQPAVRYFTLRDLLGREEDDPDVRDARSAIPKRGWARGILRLQKPGGYWESDESLYGPKYIATNWMALVLSDLGLTKGERRVRKTADLFFESWLRPSPAMNIFNDEVCIVGNTARMLTRFGYSSDPRVARLFERLVDDQKDDGGWHCFGSSKGTLDCWEALAAYAALPKSRLTRKIRRSVERGAEFYLERRLFDSGRKRYSPWLRFHYPIHYYYDVLVGLDTITRLGYGGDRRLRPALDLLNRKQQRGGTWLLDRVHPDLGPGAEYHLSRKPRPLAFERAGRPSKWITLTALRVLKRVEDSGQSRSE